MHVMSSSLAFLTLLATGDLKPGDYTRPLEVNERQRSYLLHVPASYDGARPLPVVLIFHGGASDAERMIQFCGLNDKADQAGFLAVYPNGTGQLPRALTWNGGNCCGYAERRNVDDVAFVRALLDDLAKVARIDSKRIYATGMSNGAIMAYRLASELSDRIAAIAPVSGPMGTEKCSPKRPVSVLHFHGTDDLFAPLQGGQGPRSVSGTDFYSVDHSIRAWVTANGCPETPATVNEPHHAEDGTAVTRYTYGPGKDGSEVVSIIIAGGGHTWPGRQPLVKILGKSTKNISANDVMWEFFQRHPRK
jgi:polyhydroxybutyrate depolymerase